MPASKSQPEGKEMKLMQASDSYSTPRVLHSDSRLISAPSFCKTCDQYNCVCERPRSISCTCGRAVCECQHIIDVDRQGSTSAAPCKKCDTDPCACQNDSIVSTRSMLSRQQSETSQLMEVPPNLHQITTYHCLEEHNTVHRRALALAVSAAVILAQVAAIVMITVGTARPVCSDLHPVCPTGLWCPIANVERGTAVCTYCAQDNPSFNNSKFCRADYVMVSEEDNGEVEPFLPPIYDNLEAKSQNQRDVMRKDLKAMCDIDVGCMTPGGIFEFPTDVVIGSMKQMTPGDCLALCISITVLTMYTVSEQCDIMFCHRTRKVWAKSNNHRWRAALEFLGDLRIVGSLILVVAAVPQLLLWRGTDAVSICMNAVAVVFILEVDTVIYQYGVPQILRYNFEVSHRLTLGDRELEITSHKLEKIKFIYIAVVPSFILLQLIRARYGGVTGLIIPLLSPWMVLLLESVSYVHGEREASVRKRLWGLARTGFGRTMAMVVTFVMFIIFNQGSLDTRLFR